MSQTIILKKLYLFKDLSESEIEVVARSAASKSYLPGDEIFSQGSRAKALFIIQSGGVSISQISEKNDQVEVTRLGPGSHFGEMSFLDGEARSATAAAIEPTTIIELDYDKLSEIMIKHPGIAIHFYRQFAIFLCGRLRVTTKDLSFSRSKVLSHF